jgi:uncharacterized protein YjeT (DUF2065 family)
MKNKVLKLTMFLFGLVLVIEGLLDLVIPEQRAKLVGLSDASHPALVLSILGATWIAAGAWIMVGARDPQRHRALLGLAISLTALLLIALFICAQRGGVPFGEIRVDLFVNAAFLAVLLVTRPDLEEA